MFKKLIDILKAHPRKIVFTEGTDPRILEASARLLSGTFLTPILIGNEQEILAAAEEAGFNIRGAIIIDPENYENMEAMVERMVELRKGKMTADECRAMLKKGNYFGTMLVAMGEADALLGGATYSTADTVRPALQLVKTKPGNSIVSSCFILVRPSATGDNDVLAMADCAINIKPSEDELVEIASETVSCAKIFGIEPKVAFLSYSTLGSGKGEDVDKMRNAAEKAKLAMPNVPIEGELQFDAAVSPRVAQTKCKGSKVAGYANTFIFPDINAGNIGYKIAQRLGSFEAYGPILLGLNAPINDLHCCVFARRPAVPTGQAYGGTCAEGGWVPSATPGMPPGPGAPPDRIRACAISVCSPVPTSPDRTPRKRPPPPGPQPGNRPWPPERCCLS